MNQGRYVFAQLVDFLPRKYFEWRVKKYEGNKYVKSFTCWNHLKVLLFGQLSNREGLRDLIVSIMPFKSSFHHLGFGKNVSRSNLGKANETHDVRIFQDFADKMVSIARERGVTPATSFQYPITFTHLIHLRYHFVFLYIGGQNCIMTKVE